MNKIKNSFCGAKTHFKMYKKGRQWLIAGVTVMSIGLGALGLNTVTASAATAETPVAATASATEKATAGTSAMNAKAEQSATDTASAEAPDTVDTSTANTGAEQPGTDTANATTPKADTTTPVTTNLVDATAQEVDAAKAKATADYQQTGQAQTVTAVAAEHAQDVTVNYSSTIKTDKGQVLSNKKFTNEFNFTLDENNAIQSLNSSTYGSATDTIPDGYKLTKIIATGQTGAGDVAEIDYDVVNGHATTNQEFDETPAEFDQEVKQGFTNGVVKFDGNQFTISYQNYDVRSQSGGDNLDNLYNAYDFTFIVTDTAQTKTVSQPYQTEVKTTDGTVLNSQNGTNTYVVRTADDGSVLSVTSVDYKDLTDTIPAGYHLTGIQLVDTTNVNQTVTTVTYDPSTGVGNIVTTSVGPDGQTVTDDYSKDQAILQSLAENHTSVSAMAKLMIDNLVSPEPTTDGSSYTASFKNIINSDTLLNGNVNQHSTNTVITYIVAGQPNQGGNSSGNNDNQESSNSGLDSTNTTNPNPETTTDVNSETSSDANTETTTDSSTATNDTDSTDAQSDTSDNSTATSTGNNHVMSLNNATNGGTAVTTTATGNNQVAGSKINGQTEKGTLPQTNENSASQVSALLGLGLLASFAGLFGISRRKKEQQ